MPAKVRKGDKLFMIVFSGEQHRRIRRTAANINTTMNKVIKNAVDEYTKGKLNGNR
jgi:hypothetical protein|tara:strand:- start:258 stop:425 length:168 start_codon:yes stop_codon:yes gene_type:complete